MIRWFHVEPSRSCPSYTPGLYTSEQIDTLVFVDGYIPVASAAEFDAIRTGASETMGAGTCWNGTYTTGVDKNYIQVTPIDFTAFGTWSAGHLLYEGIYDGNELPITNLTSSQALFASTASGFAVQNMRVSGTFSTADSSTNGKSPIIGNCNTGTVTNNHYTGDVTNSLAPAVNQQLGGIIGLVTGAVNVTVTNNQYSGTLTSAGGNHVGMIIGRGDGVSGTLTINGNVISGSMSVGSGELIGGYAGSVSNAIITQSNSINITSTGADVGGIVGRVISGTNTFSDCSNTGNVTGGDNTGGIIGNPGAVVIINTASNTGEINGLTNTGGIIGRLLASGSTMSDCSNTGNVTGSSSVGGIVGLNSIAAPLSGSVNSGAITGVSFVGGIVGNALSATIQDCTNNGDISSSIIDTSVRPVGGITGNSSGNITRCVNNGVITGSQNTAGITATHATGTVSECKNTANITGTIKVGGIFGRFNSGTMTDCESQGTITGSAQVGGLIGATQSGTINISNSWTTGVLGAGGTSKGGVAGGVFSGTPTVTATYWDTTIGFATSPLGTGQTTVALQTPTSNTGIYSAWDAAIWDFGTSVEYPELINTP